MKLPTLTIDRPRRPRLLPRQRRGRLVRLRRLATEHIGEVRTAAQRPSIDAIGFLQDRLHLDRLAQAGRRPRRKAGLQVAGVPLWVVLAAAGGGFAVGLGVGMRLTGRRRTPEPVRPLDAAADEIKAAWPEVTDEDIVQARGSIARLVKTIRARTGQDAEEVRERLESIAAEG